MGEVLKNLGQIGGFVALAVAVWALAKDQRRKQLIEIQDQLYKAQKEATALSEAKREEERRECDTKIHQLQGRVEALESTWGKSIGEGVAIAVTEFLKEHLKKDGT